MPKLYFQQGKTIDEVLFNFELRGYKNPSVHPKNKNFYIITKPGREQEQKILYYNPKSEHYWTHFDVEEHSRFLCSNDVNYEKSTTQYSDCGTQTD